LTASLAQWLRELLGLPPDGPPVRVELRFGSDLREGAVVAFLAQVSGLRRGAVVVIDTVATAESVRHLLTSDQATVDTISGQLRVLAPSTRIEPAASLDEADWRFGLRLSWPRHALLRSDTVAEAAASLLASLGPLSEAEAVLVRALLRPGRPAALPDAERTRPDVVAGVRSRNQGPILEASFLVAVACRHQGRAAHLLGRVSAAFRARRGAHGQLRVQRLNANGIASALARPSRDGRQFSPWELAGLIGFPIGAPPIPGLTLGAGPLLPPDRRIPTQGRLLGVSTWPQTAGRGLAQPLEGALSHTLICGPSGSGKSALATNLIVSDMVAGRGCLVVDGKGDLIRDLLERIPAGRVDDVILFNPASSAPVPGLRLFGTGSDPELAADLVLGVLRDLFRDSWGVRSDQWLRAGLVTLALDPTATLGDLPFLFSDDLYRQRLVGQLADPLLQATWAAFESMRPAERSNQLGAPLNKLTELLGRRVLRTVLSQQKPTLDLRETIGRNRIVLVSLSPGQLGVPAARLLGALIVHQLFSAVQARAAQPPNSRKPFMAYIDEPKVLGDIPVPLDGMFELARGMHVGLTMTAQSLTQLPAPVRQAAVTNAATLVAFRQTADDADLLARQLGGVTAEGVQHLDAFEIVARIGLSHGTISAPASGRTLPPPPPTSDPAEVCHRSAELYGADPATVDRALHDRHHAPTTRAANDAPVGRKRRQP
jgi:hypothetical protein